MRLLPILFYLEKFTSLSHTLYKNKFQLDTDLIVKNEIKLAGNKIECNIGVENDFISMTPR